MIIAKIKQKDFKVRLKLFYAQKFTAHLLIGHQEMANQEQGQYDQGVNSTI